MDEQANTSLGPSQHTRACLLCEALLWQLTQAHAVLIDSVSREFYDRTGFKSEADRAAGALRPVYAHVTGACIILQLVILHSILL